MSLPAIVACEACGAVLGSVVGGRLKVRIRSRLLVVRPSGTMELRCDVCKSDTDLPFRAQLDDEPLTARNAR